MIGGVETGCSLNSPLGFREIVEVVCGREGIKVLGDWSAG